MSKKNLCLFIFLIVLLGGVLRFWNLGATSFVADEFLDINSSYGYRQTGVWQAWNFNFEKPDDENINPARDQRAWIYKWQVAQVLKFFPPTEAVARSVSAFWGVLSILAVYFFASYFSRDKRAGLLAAFLFAVSPTALEFDRKLRMYAMFLPVFLVFSWSIFLFLEKKYRGKSEFIKKINSFFGFNWIWFFPAVLLGILSLMLHQLTINIVFPIAFFCLLFFVKEKRDSFLKNKYFLSLLGMALGASAVFVFFEDFSETFIRELRWSGSHWVYFSRIFSDYSHLLLAVGFFLYGFFFLYRNKKTEKRAVWLLFNVLPVLLAAAFLWKRNVGTQYVFFLWPFAITLISAGLIGTADFFRENLRAGNFRTWTLILFGGIIILPDWNYFFLENNTYRQTSSSESANYKKVFPYFKKNRLEGDVLVTRNFRNYYWSGEKIPVFTFGGEIMKKRLTLEELQKIISENPTGWIIFSENDESFVSKEALDYIAKNLERVSHSSLRGKIKVYRWGETAPDPR